MEEDLKKRNDLRPLASAKPAIICKMNGTSINELIELSGIPRPTIYRWFKTRNKLFCLIVYASAAKKAMKQFSTIQIMAEQNVCNCKKNRIGDNPHWPSCPMSPILNIKQ